MSEKLKELRKQRYEITDKRNYLHETLINFKTLQHRASCPYCEQHINKVEYKIKVPIIQTELDTVSKELEEIIAIMKPLEKEENQKRNWAKETAKEMVERFYNKNKKLLSKASRDYYTEKTTYMPTGFDTIADKTLWNKAMELYFDKHNQQENDELLFEV